ncbi:MAG: hypothetical protein JHC96_05660 [Brevundimonas sp.]|jgi:hypothetical protein|uniref:hypothetical protein n=1 Tax=Brevundimonas sp. TaxID=1871086 RepID=UPI001A2DDD08|nr:hypothetical protein [Brevundimonas sp.]MBJ7318265.1 hypothetical protein [Brevundimonas sp.]
MTGTDDLILLFRARVLMIGRREVLSAFEIQTIREADARVRIRQGVVSPAERTVIEDAVAAMSAAGFQQTDGWTSPV